MAGYMKGEMTGNYLVENYDMLDLNGDGTISYIMFKDRKATQMPVHSTNRKMRMRFWKCLFGVYSKDSGDIYLEGKWNLKLSRRR